jgi:Tol biopolymer transport system component
MWYALLGVVALVASIGGQAQAPQAQMPRANVRELATIEGNVSAHVLLPDRRTVIYTISNSHDYSMLARDTTFAYDVATKRSTPLGTNVLPESVSPQGDRLAFSRSPEGASGTLVTFLWTMPINPRTGLATGPPQRVSLRPSGYASFSRDGKMLAFRDRTGPDVTIVPAIGGPERVVATADRGGRLEWSADGRSLYLTRRGQTAIERVTIADGKSERVFSRTPITSNDVVGLSPDARVAFFMRNPDRFFYRTASGAEGEISVALPPLDSGSGYNMGLDSVRYTTMTQVRQQGVRVLDLATGAARDVLPGDQTSAPAWSPDGRRLAVVTGNRSHYEIVVVNADGSSPRRHPMPVRVEGSSGVWETPWSPDGRFLAFKARGGSTGPETVAWGPDDRSQIALLDVTTGRTRVLTTSSAPLGYGRFVWRSDGNAVRAMKRKDAPTELPARYSVVEIPLNGPERELRDISAEFPEAVPPFFFISDLAVMVTVSGVKTTERFLVPLDGGSARRLPDPALEPGTRTGNGALVAGDRVLVGQVDARGEARVIKILSTAGDATRTLRIPFNGHHGVLHPDGKQIINVGKATGDSVWKLFLVPLDGSATRLIGEIPRGTGGLLAPSPDGKLLAYTSDGSVTSKILEIDFAPALQAIVKRQR